VDAFEPKNGLVVRYDFLWKREEARGQEHGAKDRPCAIVLTSKPLEDGSRQVVVCPITHSPPAEPSSAIEIPAKVSAHLKLDGQRSWIRTHEVNVFTWEKGRVPFGVTPANRESWAFGNVPRGLYDQMRGQVLKNREDYSLKLTQRDTDYADRRAEQMER